MIRSFSYKLQMSDRIGKAFENAIAISNEFYNAALQERTEAWTKQKISISKNDQCRSLTEIRKNDDRFSKYAVTMLRAPLVQVDEAFKGFFSRLKKANKKHAKKSHKKAGIDNSSGKKKRKSSVGFPRFRSTKRVRSFGFTEASGWTLKGNDLSMKGLPNVRLKMHRPLLGEPVKMVIKKDGRGRWFAIIVVKQPEFCGPLNKSALGLDLGVENLVTDSDGVFYGKVAPDRQADRLEIEQSLARKKKGSRRWRKEKQRLAHQKQREKSKRRTQHFQVASKIIRKAKHSIFIEDLTVKNMTRSASGTIEKPGTNVAAKSGLNRSILDSGMAQFVKILSDKAESAGRLVVKVDPRGTSQECSDCGLTVKKTLNQRWHKCSCGAEYHRDHNAARNVLHRGVVIPGLSRLPLVA